MYPLLAAGATNLAGNIFESLGGMMSRKSTATQPGATAQPAAVRKPPTAAEQIATLRARLLNSPELQTALNTADPTHGASLGVSHDGTVTYTGQDGRSVPLQLSPQTADLARQFATLTTQAGLSPTGGSVPLTGANSVRSLNAFA